MSKQSVKNAFRRLARDERGASMVEYSIIISLITGGVLMLVIALGGWMTGQWTTISTALGII